MNILTIVESPSILANRLEHMDIMTDESIYHIINQTYNTFLSNIDDPCLDKLKKSSKFISILTQVMMNVELTLDQRIECNSLVYKEISANSDNQYIQKLYYILGLLINQNIVNKLIDIGLDKTLATYLAVVRKSSFKNKDNISRLNFSIMCNKLDLMTVQRISDIYCVVFNTVDDIRELFFNTVKDTFLKNNDEEWVTYDMIQVSSNINYAILSLLESLEITKLREILYDYANIVMIEDITQQDVRISFLNIDRSMFPNISLIHQEILENDKYLP